MTIRVTQGAITCNCGRRRLYTPLDGPIDLTPELEALFVAKGVAEYTGDTQAPPDAPKDGEQAEYVPQTDYESMTFAEIKALCKERGITVGGATRKRLIEALEEDDAPPTLEVQGAM